MSEILNHSQGESLMKNFRRDITTDGTDASEVKKIIRDHYEHYTPSHYKKLVHKTEKQQTRRYREQTSGYQRGEGKGQGQYRSRGQKGVTMGLYEITCVKISKTVKHYRI